MCDNGMFTDSPGLNLFTFSNLHLCTISLRFKQWLLDNHTISYLQIFFYNFYQAVVAIKINNLLICLYSLSCPILEKDIFIKNVYIVLSCLICFIQTNKAAFYLFVLNSSSDNRRGACWLEISNGQCENNINSMTLKSECCGSIGKAWGSPCEPCPTSSMYFIIRKLPAFCF